MAISSSLPTWLVSRRCLRCFLFTISVGSSWSRVAQQRDEWLLMRLDSFYTNVVSSPIGHPSFRLVTATAENALPYQQQHQQQPSAYFYSLLALCSFDILLLLLLLSRFIYDDVTLLSPSVVPLQLGKEKETREIAKEHRIHLKKDKTSR